MEREIEEKFKKILSHVSEQEKERNRALIHKSVTVLVAIEYLKASMKNKKGA
jgi:hypothetical protein